MRVFGIWSSNGYVGDMSTSGETWASMREAREVFRDRFENGGWCRDGVTRVVDIDDDGLATVGAVVDVFHPNVGEDCSLELYSGERRKDGWLITDEPFGRLVLGPRGGVRLERF